MKRGPGTNGIKLDEGIMLLRASKDKVPLSIKSEMLTC